MGQRKAAKGQAAQYAEQARIAGENAKIVDLQIADAIYRGRRSEQDVMAKGRNVAGEQRATMAARGLDLEFGSPMDAIFNTAQAFMRDASTVKRNTQNEVRDLERDKLNFESAVKGNTMASSNARKAGNFSALGGAFSGAADIYANLNS